MIDITGLDKAALLAALYNASKAQGVGSLDPSSGVSMTQLQAESWIQQAGERPHFNYLQGRVVKVDLSGVSLDPRRYDRDNGQGAAAEVVRRLRSDLSQAA